MGTHSMRTRHVSLGRWLVATLSVGCAPAPTQARHEVGHCVLQSGPTGVEAQDTAFGFGLHLPLPPEDARGDGSERADEEQGWRAVCEAPPRVLYARSNALSVDVSVEQLALAPGPLQASKLLAAVFSLAEEESRDSTAPAVAPDYTPLGGRPALRYERRLAGSERELDPMKSVHTVAAMQNAAGGVLLLRVSWTGVASSWAEVRPEVDSIIQSFGAR